MLPCRHYKPLLPCTLHSSDPAAVYYWDCDHSVYVLLSIGP